MSTTALADDCKRAAIKTRLDHFSDTKFVLVVSYLPVEIVTITCDKWKMLGMNSWHHQNDFTIPGSDNAAVAALNADSFDGYCAAEGSIIAHTDACNFVGHLDGGAGNWKSSTVLIFENKH
jgi:hypothetical protein